MSNSEDKQEKKMPAPLKAGIFITGIWFLLICSYIFVKWEKVTTLEPNNFGDVLAGAFAPLAFLWLAIAVLLQREELSLQREELKLAREEAKGSREALERTGEQAKIQATALLEQAKIMAYDNSLNQFYKELQNACTYLHTHLSKFDVFARGLGTTPLLDSPTLELFDRKDFFGFLLKIDNNLESKFCKSIAQLSLEVFGRTEADLISVERRLISFINVFSVPNHGEDIKAVVVSIAERLEQIRLKSKFHQN